MALLLVDDDGFTRAMVRTILQRLGIKEVHEAQHGEQAFHRLQHVTVHGIFCDVAMTPMDGIEFLNRLRSGSYTLDPSATVRPDANVPVIMLTGHTQDSLVDRAVKARASGYVTKPIKVPVLQKSVERILEYWRQVPAVALTYTRRPEPAFTRFVLEGAFSPEGQATMRALIQELDGEPNRRCVLDLTELATVNEHAFGAILMLNGVVTMKGRQLALVAGTVERYAALVKVGLNDMMPVFPSLADYRQSGS